MAWPDWRKVRVRANRPVRAGTFWCMAHCCETRPHPTWLCERAHCLIVWDHRFSSFNGIFPFTMWYSTISSTLYLVPVTLYVVYLIMLSCTLLVILVDPSYSRPYTSLLPFLSETNCFKPIGYTMFEVDTCALWPLFIWRNSKDIVKHEDSTFRILYVIW
jgi:hypothetical protein